jgi:endonuclease/exonuclease/phosphatase family metal-dependent hydrolase
MTVGDTLYCCTHFDANTTADRTSNLNQVVEFLHKHNDVPKIIIGGDFNINEPNDEYVPVRTAMNSYGLSDSYRVLHPNMVTDPGYTVIGATNAVKQHFSNGTSTTTCRIDYIFARGYTTIATDVIMRDFSDHQPLLALYA